MKHTCFSNSHPLSIPSFHLLFPQWALKWGKKIILGNILGTRAADMQLSTAWIFFNRFPSKYPHSLRAASLQLKLILNHLVSFWAWETYRASTLYFQNTEEAESYRAKMKMQSPGIVGSQRCRESIEGCSMGSCSSDFPILSDPDSYLISSLPPDKYLGMDRGENGKLEITVFFHL